MNIVNKVKVTICGKDYSLQTDETPEYISALAAETEKQIFDLIKLKPGFGIQNASVFVALTALDEAHKAESNIENIRAQIKSSVSEAGKARAAKEKLAAKVKDLESRIAELEKENKELKKRTAFDCEQLVLENTVTPAVTVYAGNDTRDKSEGGAASENAGNNAADVKNPDSVNNENAGNSADNGNADNTDVKSSASAKTPEESNREQDQTLSSGNSSGDCVSRGSDGKAGAKR
ncbi:MAG: cell division protein ZapA [Oscillospiraceae bacterium]|nr:cell division protein ZapA [Oscillospiraceae bacterium]